MAALLCTGGCSAAVSQLDIDSARTAARVKTALVNDEVVGPRAITVRVRGSVVELSGRVVSDAERARAVSIARSVPGVTDVESRLLIGAEPEEALVAPQDGRGEPGRNVEYEFTELQAESDALALGAALGLANQQGRDSGARVALSPLVRLGSGAGFGPAVAFDWFDATPIAPDAAVDVGRVRIRPIMGGVRYTWRVGRLSIAPSLVGGYAFNSLHVAEGGPVERLSVDVSNSAAWRPGVSFWVETGHRMTIHLSLGRVFTSPRFTVVEDGLLRARTVSADTTVLLIGLAYKVF